MNWFRPNCNNKFLAIALQLIASFVLTAMQVSTAFAQQSQYEFSDVARIVAVGDIHGDYENFKAVLLEAGLIDKRGNWVAGKTHFVQMGDLPDRGPDTDQVIKHMKKLQRQAKAAGGRVHPLIGNHEAMNMLGDLRYVHADEYAAFRTSKSRTLRSNYYKGEVERLKSLDRNFAADKAFSKQWQEAHPLGYVEHRLAWHPTGEIGSWVLENSAVIKINNTLFLHGGISPALLSMSIEQINSQIKSELRGNLGESQGLSESDDSPLWYRGLASNPEVEEVAHVDAVLQAFDVERIVLGHTPGYGIVLPRFEGKVIIIDTGISSYYGGHLASLLIEGDAYYAVHADQKLLLPTTNSEILPYLKRASALEGPTPALVHLMDSMQ